MSKVHIIAAAALIVPAPVLAQIVFQDAPRRVAPTKAAGPKSDLDQIECRAQDTTGDRLERHQVCLTKQQWLSYEQEAKQRVLELQVIGFTSH